MKNNFLLFSSILLASCSVGPDYQRPDFVSDGDIAQSLQLKNQAIKIVPADWYKQFNDQTLNYLIKNAEENSPTVQVAVQKLRQARTTLNINAGENLPQLDLDTSYHYNKPSKNIGPAIKTNYYQTGLDASWELDIWGGGRRLTEESRALFEAAAANLDNVRITLISEVANNYTSLRTSQEQLRIAKQNLKLQTEIMDLVVEKHKFGLTDDIALNQSQYAVETTKSLIPDLEYQIEAYQNALAILTGVLPGQLGIALEPVESNMVQKRFDYDVARLFEVPASTVRARPDVRIAEQNLIAKNAAVGQAVANLYPNVSISALFGYQSIRGTRLFTPQSEAFSYAPQITLPIFHWGQLVNNVELQKQIKEEYVQTYKDTLLNAVGEIKDSITAIDKEYQKNLSDYSSVEHMQKIMDYTLIKYKQGLIEFSDQLTAEQNLLQAQLTLVESNGTIYKNIIAYYKALGGGYNQEQP